MKKSILSFFICMLLINLVNAGETYKLDFSKNNAYVVGLSQGDRVQFELKDDLHTVILKKISNGDVELALFTNIDDENIDSKVPLYSRINNKKFMKLDVEKDGDTDLIILYKSSNSTVASLAFQLPIGPDKNLEVYPESQFKQDNYLQKLLYLFLFLIVVFVLIYFIFRKKAKETEEVIENKTETKAE